MVKTGPVAWDAPVIISLLEAARRFPKDGTLLKTIKAIAFDGQFASSILGINSRISEVAWITYLEAELAQVGPGHEKDRVNRLLEWRRETLKRTDDPAVWRLAKLRAIERLLKKCDPTLLRGVLLLMCSEAQQGANQSARAQDEEIFYLSRIVREISVPTGQDK